MNGLREALDALAEEMPPATVAGDVWARAGQARRRRRVATVAGAFAAIVVVLAGVALLPGSLGRERTLQPAGPGERDGIPAAIHDPWAWTPTVEQSPPGRAAALAEGSLTSDYLAGALDEYRYLVVGGERDTYRFASPLTPSPPGVMTFLSPDGTRTAGWSEGARRLSVRDLRSGEERLYGAYSPLAWAPDGRALAVATYAGMATGSGLSVDVYRLDLPSGRATRLLRGVPSNPFVPGLAAAWSPDGRRLAAVFGRGLHLVSADGSAHTSQLIPPRTLLAGPGAWSPDGRQVLLASLDCASACPPGQSPESPATWSLVPWDVGRRSLDRQHPIVLKDRLAAVRVIAWSSPDSVVAVTHAARYHPSLIFSPDVDPASLLIADDTSVVELRRDGRRRVLARYPGIGWLDLAADIAATAKLRPADGPSPWPVHTYWLIGVSIPLGLLMLPVLAALIWWRTRLRRASRSGAPGSG